MNFKKIISLIVLTALTSAQLWGAAGAAGQNKPKSYIYADELCHPKSLQLLAAEAAVHTGVRPIGQTDISSAAREHLELAEYVKNNGKSPYRAFRKAIDENKSEYFLNQLLTAYNLDPNHYEWYGESGHSPLTQAAQKGNLIAVRALLNHGADASANNNGALNAAAAKGHTEIAYLLLPLVPEEQQEQARFEIEFFLQQHERQMREKREAEEAEEAYQRQQEEELRNTYLDDGFEESHPGYGD